jgi:LysR family nitrogen assimilation transcriptional regulator
MDLRQLRYFVQIVESGSLSRAAEILGIAQPSLSVQVKALEEELGVDLLIRHPRGVTPTDLGIAFRDHAQLILDNMDRAREAVRSQVSSPVATVAVGLPASVCRGVALHLVRETSNRYPGISVHLVEAMSGTLEEWIQAGRLDVAALFDHRAYEHISAVEIMTEDLVLHVPARSGLAGTPAIPFAKLAGVPLVLPSPGHVVRSLVAKQAGLSGCELSVMNCDSLPATRQLVRAGYATIAPHFAFAEEIERGELAVVPIVDPTPSWRISIGVSRRTVHPRAAHILAGVLEEVCRDLVRTGIWRATLAG